MKTQVGMDLSIKVEPGKGDAFGLEPPSYTSLLPSTASCQVHRIEFCAHSSGTHTECVSHITKDGGDFAQVFASQPAFCKCLVVRLVPQLLQTCIGETYANSDPRPSGSELVVSRAGLHRAMHKFAPTEFDGAVMLQLDKKDESDWVFFTDQAMEYLVDEFCTFTLLVNHVSVDRERCGLAMPAHSKFFLPQRKSNPLGLWPTITENVKTDRAVATGVYWLNLQLAPFLHTDAVPTAQVVTNFFARRGKRHGNSFSAPDMEAQARRNVDETPPPAVVFPGSSILAPKEEEPAETKAAKVIQAFWRGCVLRFELRHMLLNPKLSGGAVQMALDFVLDWGEGWKKLGVMLFLLIFFMVTVHTQTTSAAYSSDRSFTSKLDVPGLADARALVQTSNELYSFMHEWIDNFPPALASSETCNSALVAACPHNLTLQSQILQEVNLSNISFLDYLTRECDNVSSSSGYVDPFNRVVGTTYVYQTRRKTVPCEPRMIRLSPYLGVARDCLDNELDLEFNPPPLTANCGGVCAAFEVYPDSDFYAYALTGGSFNIPNEFMHCRVRELEQGGWLDYKTKQVCFLISLVDKNGQGGMIAYKECFEFVMGGKVNDIREIASLSFFAEGSTTPIVLTIFSLLFTITHQALVCIRAPRWKMVKPSFWVRLLAPAFEIASNIMFLCLVVQLERFGFNQPVTQDAFFQETFAFLEDSFDAFELASFRVQHTVIASLALLFRLADVMRHLDFHPSSAIVGGVLHRSSINLISFAFVFFTFLIVYAFVGVLLFSSTVYMFETLGDAINTLLLIAVGDMQTLVEETMVKQTNPANLVDLESVYFWFYIFIVGILLFNVLLAIIVGAYVEMTDVSKHGGAMLSFPRSLMESLRFLVLGGWVQTKRLLCRKRWGEMTTPTEQLLALRKQHRNVGCTAIQLRRELSEIMLSSTSVELMITRCRAQTKHEQLETKALYLRGMDSDSNVLKGYNIFLLESIDKRVKGLLASQQQRREEN
ncbi:hypothetical protein BASA81_010303 [Batrachochytrium salamandrivorans]|nr:hypothetical protein BASA81_010303 [Batrachochytrium salamandrivorans]